METSEQCRNMTEKCQRQRILKTSFMKAAKSARLKHHLPTDTTEYTPSRRIPCQQRASPTVRTELLDPFMNRSMLAPKLKTAVMETIDAYPFEAILAYTDGSAFKVTLNAAYGAVIIYPNVHPDDNPRILRPCGQYNTADQLHCRNNSYKNGPSQEFGEL
jgi:hypothetical protein